MIEIIVLWLLKGTLALAVAAWGIVLAGGYLGVAIAALGVLFLIALLLGSYSDRLRGKRGEGGP